MAWAAGAPGGGGGMRGAGGDMDLAGEMLSSGQFISLSLDDGRCGGRHVSLC